MKNKLMILVFLISLIFIFSNTFIIESSVITNDNRLSLKDFFSDIPFDRTITFLNTQEVKYSKDQLTNLITPFLNIYYDDYDLQFESEEILIKRGNNETYENFYDFKPFLNSFMQREYPNLTIIGYENLPNVFDVSEIKVVNSFLNKDNVFISLKYKTEDIYKFSSIKIIVEKLESVLISKDIISTGEKLTTENTYEATINILKFNFETVSNGDIFLEKYESTKIFHKDEPINKTYLKMIPDVFKGEVVNIFVNIGGISIHTLGKATENGTYEHNITVKNIETGKMVSGILKKGPSVFVNLGGEWY